MEEEINFVSQGCWQPNVYISVVLQLKNVVTTGLQEFVTLYFPLEQ